MDDVKWIKISVGMLDNKKIKYLRSLPDGDSLVLLWVSLLCLAGNINDSGMIYLVPEIPFTEQLLSTQLCFPLTVIQLGLQQFEKLGMIEIIDNIICVSNWERYQNVEGMEKIREQTKQRVRNFRERKALEACNVTVTQCNATDIDKDIEQDKDKEIDKRTIEKDPFISLKSNPDLYQTLRDFEEMRRKIKKPMTARSKALLLKKLGEYHDEDWIPMLEQSIEHCWQTVYPLKEGRNEDGRGSGSNHSDADDSTSKFNVHYDA